MSCPENNNGVVNTNITIFPEWMKYNFELNPTHRDLFRNKCRQYFVDLLQNSQIQWGIDGLEAFCDYAVDKIEEELIEHLDNFYGEYDYALSLAKQELLGVWEEVFGVYDGGKIGDTKTFGKFNRHLFRRPELDEETGEIRFKYYYMFYDDKWWTGQNTHPNPYKVSGLYESQEEARDSMMNEDLDEILKMREEIKDRLGDFQRAISDDVDIPYGNIRVVPSKDSASEVDFIYINPDLFNSYVAKGKIKYGTNPTIEIEIPICDKASIVFTLYKDTGVLLNAPKLRVASTGNEYPITSIVEAASNEVAYDIYRYFLFRAS